MQNRILEISPEKNIIPRVLDQKGGDFDLYFLFMFNRRTIFIGDVHGCYDELRELVQKIDLREEDHLYFVGDLINK